MEGNEPAALADAEASDTVVYFKARDWEHIEYSLVAKLVQQGQEQEPGRGAG